jgi:ribose transport system permease protein
LRGILSLVRLGPLVVLGSLVVLMALLSDVFLNERNLLNVGIQATPIALLAIGQFVVILTRGIDLSVGAVAALASVCGALVWSDGSGSALLALGTVLGIGLACGLVNGVLFVGFKIPHPFIVTLGTLNVATGAAYLLADGEAVVGVPDFAAALGNDKLLGIPYPILVVLATLAIFVLLLRGTVLGTWIYAVGGDPEAARRMGIPVSRVLVLAYTLSGLTAALAAIILLGRTGTGDPNYSSGLAELQAIAAVIIGGTSFFGGRGNVITVVIGALVLAVIANGLNLLNVNAFWQLVVTGFVLITAVILDVFRTRLEERFRTVGAEA